MTRQGSKHKRGPFKQFKRSMTQDKAEPKKEIKQPDLRVIHLSPDQEKNKTLKFIYDLP